MAFLLLRPLETLSSPLLTFSRKFSVKPLPFATLGSFKRFSSVPIMATSARKALVPIANGTEPLEAIVVIDLLRRAGADVTVASVENRLQVDACLGIKIVADALVSDCVDTAFDLIFPTCTCHPSLMEQLSSSAIVVEDTVQQDGNVVRNRGPGTIMEFSVALVEQLLGKDKAEEVSAPLVMRPKHGDEYSILELNPMKWTCNEIPKILVPIADGTEEMEATMIIDVLRRAKAEVVVASVGETLDIIASRKVKLVADTLLKDAAKHSFDLIVLPGGLGGAQAFSKSEKLVEMLKKQFEANKPYGAICASPALVLEPHGLLKGKKATAFPAMCSKLTDQSEINNRVVVDGNLITSRGPGTSIEFALAIVEKFWDHEKALALAKTLMFVHP